MEDELNRLERTVVIPPSGVAGDLSVLKNSAGLVIFAHGSGSSRFSSRNRFVADTLQRSGFTTLLLDLLTPEEEDIDLQTRQLRFDIPLLAKRLAAATQWAASEDSVRSLPVGYFGASTGAAAALIAASQLRESISAVVSRGGRPDLVGSALIAVRAATLLIVGARDHQVLGLNQNAFSQLQCEKKLEIVPGASHLFEEPGTLERVAALAASWFAEYLRR